MLLNSAGQNFSVISLLLLSLLPAGQCRSGKMETTSSTQRRVANGLWGGQNVQLDVTEDGANVRFSCAHGKIEQPLTLDAEGHFSVKGTFVAEGMGPTHEDNPPKSQPAVFKGVVHNSSMTLTVTVTDAKEEGGSFELTQGQPGRIRRCH
jgi:hypothetical protein